MAVESNFTTQLPALRLSQRRQWARKQAVSFLMQQGVENHDVISLGAGLVDQESLPVEETRAALKTLLSDHQRVKQALQYGTTPGAEPLRRQLLEQLARLEGCPPEELGIDADQLILTTGSQQLLSLVGDVLLDPGDICLVAAPTYFVFLGTVAGLGARTISVATDDGGMRPEALEALFERLLSAGQLDRVKLIYVVSYYDNPAGLSLSAQRREAVLDIVRRWSKPHRIFILEDAAYRELRYDGPVLPSLWSFDTTRESVILAQTFSKSFSPGLRVGFGVVPAGLVKPICDRKGNEDFGSANFNQHLIAGVIEQGLYDSHVAKLRDSYRAKRDCMLAAADRYFADIPGVSWVHPHGGLYVWMTVPPAIDAGFDGPLFDRATNVERVMYVPGELFYADEPDDRPRNQMRLSYGVQTPEGIELGMQRLARAVRAVL